jgi:hypothetical protein
MLVVVSIYKIPPSVIVQLLGAPVNNARAALDAEVYFALPKLIVMFGLTGLELHPLYIASKFADESVAGVLFGINNAKLVQLETFHIPMF